MVVCCGCLMSGPVLKNRSSRLYIDIFLLPRLFCKACDVYKKRGTQRVGTFSFIKCLWYEMEVLPEARNARSKKATHQWPCEKKKASLHHIPPYYRIFLCRFEKTCVVNYIWTHESQIGFVHGTMESSLSLSHSLLKHGVQFWTHHTHVRASMGVRTKKVWCHKESRGLLQYVILW